MPPLLTGEQPGDAPPRKGLVRAVLVVMALIGGLAFLRAFAGGEGVAVQRLAWGSLAWTFPLLWDLTSVIGSVLWVGAPRHTAARRWGVALNLGGTIVSGLATGSQAYTLARDQVPQGWPVPAFLAGFAVPLIYSILTWAAASAAEHLTGRSNPWSTPTSSTASAPATDAAPSEVSTSTLPASPAGSARPPLGAHALRTYSEALPGTSEPLRATLVTAAPDPTPEEATTSPVSLSGSSGAGTPTPEPSAPSESAPAGEPTPASTSPSPDPTGTPTSPPGPTPPQDEPSTAAGSEEDEPRSTPADREAWAVSELLRRAESPGAEALRPRDIDREFGEKDGWRILDRARRRVAQQAEDATVGAER